MPASCEKPEADFTIKPLGDKFCDLPPAHRAPVFEPEYGCYAELVRDGGAWQSYINGQLQGRVQTEDELNEFGEQFYDQAQEVACEAKVLISADRDMSMDDLIMPIRALAASGICKYYFNTRNSKTAGGSGVVRAPMLDLSMYVAIGDGYPMLIEIIEGGSIRNVDGESKEVLDGADAGPSLPGLSRELTEYGGQMEEDGLRPALHAVFRKGASYQRFVDVLNCAQRHDAHFAVPVELPLSEADEGR